jgi:hypothetical protein
MDPNPSAPTTVAGAPSGGVFVRLNTSARNSKLRPSPKRTRQDRGLKEVFRGFFAANAHTVAVDPRTHRVYWPLQNVGGKPVLRITAPTDK